MILTLPNSQEDYQLNIYVSRYQKCKIILRCTCVYLSKKQLYFIIDQTAIGCNQFSSSSKFINQGIDSHSDLTVRFRRVFLSTHMTMNQFY